MILLVFALVAGAWLVPSTARSSAYTPVFPLRVSSNGRYLVDQNNVPFMVVGDSPQSLIGNLSEAQADTYFADREAMGYNAVWINLLCASYTFCNSNGTTYDGIAPFTTPGDLSTPNPAYFSRVDDMLNLAAKHHIVVFLDPAETGSWLSTLQNNGATKDYNYGVYLGNRYKNFPNIIWQSGNDYWANDDTDVQAVAKGIRAADPNHLQTIELNPLTSGSQDDSNWVSFINLDAAYSYYPTYAQVLKEYNRATLMPTFMVEANYEFENNNNIDTGTPAVLRRQEYWAMLSGATGQLYGNHYTVSFASGWQQNLDTPGAIQLGYMTHLFAQRPWQNLVPDQNHTVVTAGYGTFASSGSISSNDYLTAARTSDGSLIMAYMPTSRTITVDMTKLSGSATAQWYDPTNGTYITVAGSPFSNTGSRQFTPPGTNSGGNSDWVLVLQTGGGSSPTATPTTPAPTATQAAATSTPVASSTPTPSGATFVQEGETHVSSGSTVSVTLPSAVKAGDLLVAYVLSTKGGAVSATDTRSDSYQSGAGPTLWSGNQTAQVLYAANVAGGTTTVTANVGMVTSYGILYVVEYAGLAQANPVDAATTASGIGSAMSSGTLTTTNGTDLLFGGAVSSNTVTGASPGASVRSTGYGNMVEDRSVMSPGAYSLTGQQNGTAWGMQVVAFRQAATSSSPTNTPVAPTNTPVPPTATPTNTRVAPTNTPVPPTNTPVPVPTNTPVPTTTTSTPSYVQGSSATPQSPQTSVTVSYPRSQTAGDLNVVAIGWNDTSTTISSVRDSAGNSYQVAVPMASGTNLRQAIYYAPNVKGATSNTITVTFSKGAAYPDIRVLEYAHINALTPFDAGASAAGSGTMADSGAVTTSSGTELVIGAGMTAGGYTGAGSGHTTRMITSPDADIAEDRVVTTSGSYHATAPLTNYPWLMQVVAVKAG